MLGSYELRRPTIACFACGAPYGACPIVGARPAAGACLGSGRSRVATGFFSRRFSHSLSSLRNEPSAHTILTQESPSTLKPCSQTSGQTRAVLLLIESSASVEASLVSNLVLL